jgi:hypothetical protein
MPNYGIWQEKDLALDDLAAGVDRDALLEAQQETVASHNQKINAFLDIFADRLTVGQIAVGTGGNNRLQPLDENGRPQPVKAPGQYIVGFPLYKAGTAEGWNFWTSEQMTVKNYADSLSLMLKGDVTWLRDQLFATLFYAGAGFAYANNSTGESFTVFGLANGDTVVYDAAGGAATDSHLSFQAAAISDAANPFPAIYADLIEHPGNAGRVVSFVPPGLVSAIQLLAGYAPANPDLIRLVPGSATAQPDPNTAPALGVPLPSTMQYMGAVGNCYIVQWQNLPANYIVSVAIDADVKPLAMREFAQPALRGLINIGEPMSRFPYQQTNYLRAAGFGGRNRIAAHVLKIAASYAAPTTHPLPLA